jgi:hypothetical protein
MRLRDVLLARSRKDLSPRLDAYPTRDRLRRSPTPEFAGGLGQGDVEVGAVLGEVQKLFLGKLGSQRVSGPVLAT